MTAPTDQLERLEADPDDFAFFFQTHYDQIFYYFFRRGFSREESRDLTQETFLEALRGRARYRGDAPPGAWIHGIAQNIYRATLRHQNRQKRSAQLITLESWLEHEPGALANDDQPQPLERSMALERARLFREAIGRLAPEQQDCLLLRIDQECSYRDISALLDVPIGTVKARLHKAKRVLGKALSQHFENDLP